MFTELDFNDQTYAASEPSPQLKLFYTIYVEYMQTTKDYSLSNGTIPPYSKLFSAYRKKQIVNQRSLKTTARS